MRIPKKTIAHCLRSASIFACSFCVAWVLAGCSDKQPPQTEPVTRPVKTLVIGGADATGVRTFPARIAASQRADLAFRVPGTVQELPIKEGDSLKAGELVAKLDPKDYQIVVDDRRATFDKERKTYQRAKRLIESGAISQLEFDRVEAQYKKARAALDAATQDLSYTELKAPFDGIVATRLVERFEEVQAKQAIATLQNLDMLEVKFDVPESIIRSIRASGDASETSNHKNIHVVARFDDQPGKDFPLTFKEITTRADPKTQTFEATYLMKQWGTHLVLPGMTATVAVDLSDYMSSDQTFTVPVSAVVGDYRLEPRIWLVDESTMTVSPRSVKVGRLVGNGIEVLEGLEPGDRVVTAGTPFLVKGIRVTLMPNLEQAKPRPEDLKYQQ
jgi:RND family efflux transporter MFP subunit